jgi:carbamoylphosphate synthase small subunit
MFIIPVFLDKRAYHKQKWRNEKEKDMVSKSFESRENQKEYWGSKLDQRLSFLTEKGFEPGKIAKDITVRKLRAKLRETGSRLKTIASKEKKVKEMARIKAEKAAAPKEEKGKKKKEAGKTPEKSKRQQKKSKKQASKSKE